MSDTFELHREWIVPHTRLMLDSHRRWLGRELIERSGDAVAEARALFEAPIVVVSSGAGPDPILSYGNAAATRLWSMDWDAFTRTPARETAEPMHRAERDEFLRRVREHGCIEDYSGVRISARGERFRIEGAVVWNLIDARGTYAGQAAAFGSWRRL